MDKALALELPSSLRMLSLMMMMMDGIDGRQRERRSATPLLTTSLEISIEKGNAVLRDCEISLTPAPGGASLTAPLHEVN